MNPSARGWIRKLLKALKDANVINTIRIDTFYDNLRSSGFIYGSNVKLAIQTIEDKDLTEEERSKINLLLAFLSIYNTEASDKDFISSVNDFYWAITEHKASIFDDILGGKIASTTLEKIIHKRIQIDDNVLTKNFNYFIINALLFVDVLAYQRYLKADYITEAHIIKLEAAIETIVINLLDSKANKTAHDTGLIELLEASLRYEDNAKLSYNKAIALITDPLETKYLFDMTCMSTWSDQQIDEQERHFLVDLGTKLKLGTDSIDNSIATVEKFYTNNKDNIAILSSKNVIETFYDNSSKMVKKLISRNSKRLQKELVESKELMKLLSKSTVRDLTKEEQKRLQGQLIDVFKSIPSLAIFILPGGALLLPLVVKFIPNLLPSAFDDNRIEDEQE